MITTTSTVTDASTILRADRNEGRCFDAARNASRALCDDALAAYPDAAALERRLAARHGVRPEQLLVTAGADDAIDRVMRTRLCPGRTLLTTTPTFEMYGRYAALTGATVRTVPWWDGPLPIAELVAALDDTVGVIALASPNNPTGTVASANDLRAIARRAPGAVLLADLAYVEFADTDPQAALLEEPNVVVTRTLSKACGLAGLRVGYAIARDASMIEPLRRGGHPYPVAAPSLAIAEASLHAIDRALPAHLDCIRRERDELTTRLTRGAMRVWPSAANFVLAEIGDAATFARAAAQCGVRVRTFTAPLERLVRVSCPGDAERFARVLAALDAGFAALASSSRNGAAS